MQKKIGPTMRFPCFSSSESIKSCNTTSVAMPVILNYGMNGLLNFWTLECWMKHVGWKCANENIGFHPTYEIPSKILSKTNIKCWMKCWMYLPRPLKCFTMHHLTTDTITNLILMFLNGRTSIRMFLLKIEVIIFIQFLILQYKYHE